MGHRAAWFIQVPVPALSSFSSLRSNRTTLYMWWMPLLARPVSLRPKPSKTKWTWRRWLSPNWMDMLKEEELWARKTIILCSMIIPQSCLFTMFLCCFLSVWQPPGVPSSSLEQANTSMTLSRLRLSLSSANCSVIISPVRVGISGGVRRAAFQAAALTHSEIYPDLWVDALWSLEIWKFRVFQLIGVGSVNSECAHCELQ